MRYLPDNNLSYPILLTLDNGSRGSGFYLNYKNEDMYIVTARHVLYEENREGKLPKFSLKTRKIKVLSYTADLNNETPSICEIDLTALPPESFGVSSKHDIAIIKIAKLTRIPDSNICNTNFLNGYVVLQPCPGEFVAILDSYFKKFEDVLVSNEAIVFGYPVSLGAGIDYERPLLRKGIVAGKNIKDRTIILDCPVYQGNSGGLVLEIDGSVISRKSQVIGIVSAFVPFTEVFRSIHFGYENKSIENSGYSIITPIDIIIELIEAQSSTNNETSLPVPSN